MTIKRVDLFVAICLIVAFSSSFPATHISQSVGYIALAIPTFYGIAKFVIQKNKRGFRKDIFNTIMAGNLNIKILIHLYSIGLVVFGLTEKRFLSGNLQTYINAVSALGILLLLGERTLKVSVSALIISFFLGTICQIPSGHVTLHDLSFGAAYVLIYIFVIQNRANKKNVKWVLLCGLVLIISDKVIQGLGFLAVVTLYVICRRLKVPAKNFILNSASIAMTFVSYLFVYLVTSNKLFQIINQLGITAATSGRNYYYKVAHDIASFSPKFLGYGRNSMQVMFGTEYSYMRVGNIHSDILRMFCECGFLLFSLWLLNYFFVFPHLIKRKFGNSAKDSYLYITYFTFICYFTDNIELYLIAQYFYMLVLIFACIQTKKPYIQKGMLNRHGKVS